MVIEFSRNFCVIFTLLSGYFALQTWISNRRRKYRLMGIDIPPPKGGPAVFTGSPAGTRSPAALSADGEGPVTPELVDDLNDEGSMCLSEGEADVTAEKLGPPAISAFMLCSQFQMERWIHGK